MTQLALSAASRFLNSPSSSLEAVPLGAPSRSYQARILRLSEKSVAKHFDAYADVDWNRADYRIDPHDPRFQKGDDDPLGRTEWYRAQPEAVRARIGLHHVAMQMKLGIDFEAVLAHGLLNFTRTLPVGAPEFRYAYHEIIEEGQHSLMFQEFVNRAGLPVHGLTGFEAFGSRLVPGLARTFPELFFLFVLGGEAPIDDVQRRALTNRDLHPLLRRVMQIHVTEEARHLCFAKAYLKEHVPQLGAFRRFQLKVRTPILLSVMAESMMKPPTSLIRYHGIPRAVVKEAYGSVFHRAQVMESLSPIHVLCEDLGLATGKFASMWRGLGIAPALPPSAPRRLNAPGVVRALPSSWLDGSRESKQSK